jgi:uncharacterized protein YbjT (DUF2867 family)
MVVQHMASGNSGSMAARPVLVTGATGMQGGGVARALRSAGAAVTALVRDPDSPGARALERDGISLRVGDLEDRAALESACMGRAAVFSVQLAPSRDPDSERRQARNLVHAARVAGVPHFVHSSVSGTGWRTAHPEVDPGITRNYWDSKEEAEAGVRGAGFPAWTIVKPAFFMENFAPPKVDWMFPLLGKGELLVACRADTPVALICAEDFAAAVTKIMAETERYSGEEIELGSDSPTFTQIAETLTAAGGRPVQAISRPAAEVDQRLGPRAWSATQVWFDAVGYPARPAHAAEHGLAMPTTFRQWVASRRDQIPMG